MRHNSGRVKDPTDATYCLSERNVNGLAFQSWAKSPTVSAKFGVGSERAPYRRHRGFVADFDWSVYDSPILRPAYSHRLTIRPPGIQDNAAAVNLHKGLGGFVILLWNAISKSYSSALMHQASVFVCSDVSNAICLNSWSPILKLLWSRTLLFWGYNV